MSDFLTVEVLVETQRAGGGETFESILSRWQAVPPTRAAAWDAGGTSGHDTAGYYGSVFDGRRVVFAPMQFDRDSYHGNVLTYDTAMPFASPDSYRAWDAVSETGEDARGYYGAIFDGRRTLFVPRKTEDRRHGMALSLEIAASGVPTWKAYRTGRTNCHQGGAFDGRYAYFAPGFADEDPHSESDFSGSVTRFDTRCELDDPGAWDAFDAASLHPENACFDGACFDGRYVYFAPLQYRRVVRFDTLGDFQDPSAWQSYDAAPRGLGLCVGAQFDGVWVYFAPYGHGRVVRFRVDGDFDDAAAWETFDIGDHPLATRVGYDGAFFNGRHVSFIPFVHLFEDGASDLHGQVATYDTLQPFADPNSWTITDNALTDGLSTVGYNGGAYDGRYLYCAPWREAIAPSGRVAHGRILRWDTASADSVFSLRWSSPGHNGGLCGGIWGPSFMLQTSDGHFGVHSAAALGAGRHHLAGVYDGKKLRLFSGDRLLGECPASGQVLESSLPVTEGQFHEGGASFHGRILASRISESAVLPSEFIQ